MILIVVPQTNQWYKLKTPVLDSVSSPITKRVYNLGLNEFLAVLQIEVPGRFHADNGRLAPLPTG
jgi:hypothetical protein